MVMVNIQEGHHHQLQRVVITGKAQTNLEMNMNRSNKMRNQNKMMMMNQLWTLNLKTWTMRAEPLYCTHAYTGTKTAP